MRPDILKHFVLINLPQTAAPKVELVEKNKDLPQTHVVDNGILLITAFGGAKEINSKHLEELNGNFQPVAAATFQDAKDGGPIFPGDEVAQWNPEDQNYKPPNHARVTVALDKLRHIPKEEIPKIYKGSMFYSPTVQDFKAMGIEPDGKDTYLVGTRSSRNDPDVKPIGASWITQNENGEFEQCINVMGYD